MPKKERLSEEDRAELSECYALLSHYTKLRESGVDCWKDYYRTLKRIKHILRYG